MNLKEFAYDLVESNLFNSWVQDSSDHNIYYYWRNSERGYRLNYKTSEITECQNANNYMYHDFSNDELKEQFNIALSKKLDEQAEIDSIDEIMNEWVQDTQNENIFYYWKGSNSGYMVEINDTQATFPKVINVKNVDGDYLRPSLMKEFKNYKVKRALKLKLEEIKKTNESAKEPIFNTWTQDNDSNYYYWKSESNGYKAVINKNPLPVIESFELVGEQYFEPRNLEPVSDFKVKTILEKKIK